MTVTGIGFDTNCQERGREREREGRREKESW